MTNRRTGGLSRFSGIGLGVAPHLLGVVERREAPFQAPASEAITEGDTESATAHDPRAVRLAGVRAFIRSQFRVGPNSPEWDEQTRRLYDLAVGDLSDPEAHRLMDTLGLRHTWQPSAAEVRAAADEIRADRDDGPTLPTATELRAAAERDMRAPVALLPAPPGSVPALYGRAGAQAVIARIRAGLRPLPSPQEEERNAEGLAATLRAIDDAAPQVNDGAVVAAAREVVEGAARLRAMRPATAQPLLVSSLALLWAGPGRYSVGLIVGRDAEGNLRRSLNWTAPPDLSEWESADPERLADLLAWLSNLPSDPEPQQPAEGYEMADPFDPADPRHRHSATAEQIARAAAAAADAPCAAEGWGGDPFGSYDPEPDLPEPPPLVCEFCGAPALWEDDEDGGGPVCQSPGGCPVDSESSPYPEKEETE
jgi:hypothetical protein